MFVLQQLDRLRADPAQQGLSLSDRVCRQVQRLGDPFLGHTHLDRPAHHLVGLDRRDVDTLPVVGVALVVRGDQTEGLVNTQLLECFDPLMAVEKQILVPLFGMNHQGLDDADLPDRCQDCLEGWRELQAVLQGLGGEQLGQL